MKKKNPPKGPGDDARRLTETSDDRYVLRLYVAGGTPASQRAIKNVKDLCEERLRGRYELEIVDIYQQPVLARVAHIVAIPSLIQAQPSPCRRFVGDMSRLAEALQDPEWHPHPTW